MCTIHPRLSRSHTFHRQYVGSSTFYSDAPLWATSVDDPPNIVGSRSQNHDTQYVSTAMSEHPGPIDASEFTSTLHAHTNIDPIAARGPGTSNSACPLRDSPRDRLGRTGTPARDSAEGRVGLRAGGRWVSAWPRQELEALARSARERCRFVLGRHTAGSMIGARFFAITDLWGVSRVAGSAPVGALGFVADCQRQSRCRRESTM